MADLGAVFCASLEEALLGKLAAAAPEPPPEPAPEPTPEEADELQTTTEAAPKRKSQKSKRANKEMAAAVALTRLQTALKQCALDNDSLLLIREWLTAPPPPPAPAANGDAAAAAEDADGGEGGVIDDAVTRQFIAFYALSTFAGVRVARDEPYTLGGGTQWAMPVIAAPNGGSAYVGATVVDAPMLMLRAYSPEQHPPPLSTYELRFLAAHLYVHLSRAAAVEVRTNLAVVLRARYAEPLAEGSKAPPAKREDAAQRVATVDRFVGVLRTVEQANGAFEYTAGAFLAPSRTRSAPPCDSEDGTSYTTAADGPCAIGGEPISTVDAVRLTIGHANPTVLTVHGVRARAVAAYNVLYNVEQLARRAAFAWYASWMSGQLKAMVLATPGAATRTSVKYDPKTAVSLPALVEAYMTHAFCKDLKKTLYRANLALRYACESAMNPFVDVAALLAKTLQEKLESAQ
jgi:hypothetical protein